jgi:hypothetical protein
LCVTIHLVFLRSFNSYCSIFRPAFEENSISLSRLACSSARFLDSNNAFLELAWSLFIGQLMSTHGAIPIHYAWKILAISAVSRQDCIFPRRSAEHFPYLAHQPIVVTPASTVSVCQHCTAFGGGGKSTWMTWANVRT